MASKLILFTATPYRNDYKGFNIDEKYFYKLNYTDAVKKNILRSVKFLPTKPLSSDQEFVTHVIDEFEKIFGKLANSDYRIIVRCDNAESIKYLTRLFISRSVSCIGIHENFKKETLKEKFFSKVPEQNDAKVWVHQFKLTEGIDDSSFRFLAFHSALGNDRQLIQQIGRIIRNPEFKSSTAYIIDSSNKSYSQIWKKYLQFDKDSANFKLKSIADRYLDHTKQQQLKYEYIQKKFREKLTEDNFTPSLDLRLPLRTSFIQKGQDFNLNTFITRLGARLRQKDFIFYKKFKKDKGEAVFYCLSISNSEFLTDKYSLNVKNSIIVIKDLSGYLCFFDSEGSLPLNDSDLGTGPAIPSNLLKKLLSDFNKAVVTRVSMKNSALGLNALRSKMIAAVSIANTTPFLDDDSQVISNAAGTIVNELDAKKKSRRYLGFDKGKVSQYDSYVTLLDYFLWLEMLKQALEGTSVALPLFNRYALNIDDINTINKSPKNILLDLSDIEDEIETAEITENGIQLLIPGESVTFSDLCLDVQNERNNYFLIWFLKIKASIQLQKA
ncbi:DEAD/DEAH box helicase [Pontibacter pudoricolor]|uniref:DEAD/DEAH box helicase n=1 Tax=Pontibacter pudoricolor TaxID=2694930 RepID=UPI00139197F4|nr:hypothetical protein [Pontibacter pudoricolor]